MKRASKLWTPSIHQEDVRAFIEKMLRGHRQSFPLLTRHEGTFSFKVSHMPLSSPEYYLAECLLLCKRNRVR
jgi:hypothetical protein